MRYRFVFLFLSLLMMLASSVEQAAPQKNSHPGTIIDAYQRNGILADAYAYASQTLNKGTDCPTYGSTALDSQKSSPPSGGFTFHVDIQQSGYLAVYCKQGYAPRTETANDNSTNNTRVQPDPITLYPKSLPGVSSAQVSAVAIAVDVEGLHANFSYYARSNEVAFSKAMESPRFSDEDRNIINMLLVQDQKPYSQQKLPYSPQNPPYEKWRPQERVESPAIAFGALTSDLNHVRSDFRYYAWANEGGYKEALSKFRPDVSQAIETIRTRKQPFGNPR